MVKQENYLSQYSADFYLKIRKVCTIAGYAPFSLGRRFLLVIIKDN